MGLTGKYRFRKTFWAKIVLQLEEEVKPLWSRSKPNALKRRWRDAKLMDLADPAMRPLIDMRSKPHLTVRSASGLEAELAQRDPTRTHDGAVAKFWRLPRVEHAGGIGASEPEVAHDPERPCGAGEAPVQGRHQRLESS